MISIVIPVHNRNEYLAESLESCINQTFEEEYEILVVKSQTNEQVEKTLKAYEKYIRVITVSETEVGDKWNKGIEAAKYDWIKIHGSDDILLPDALDCFYFNCVDKIKFYYTYFHYIDSYGMITECLTHLSLVTSCFHNDLFNKIGKFDSKQKYEDQDFMQRISKEDLIQIPEFTSQYRQHTSQSMNTPRYAR